MHSWQATSESYKPSSTSAVPRRARRVRCPAKPAPGSGVTGSPRAPNKAMIIACSIEPEERSRGLRPTDRIAGPGVRGGLGRIAGRGHLGPVATGGAGGRRRCLTTARRPVGGTGRRGQPDPNQRVRCAVSKQGLEFTCRLVVIGRFVGPALDSWARASGSAAAPVAAPSVTGL